MSWNDLDFEMMTTEPTGPVWCAKSLRYRDPVTGRFVRRPAALRVLKDRGYQTYLGAIGRVVRFEGRVVLDGKAASRSAIARLARAEYRTATRKAAA